MVKFTEVERKFLVENEVCRVATMLPDNTPHIAPVCFVFLDKSFLFATDYNTRKYKNLKQNKNVALVVDIYNSPDNKAIVIRGIAKFIERGIAFKRIYDIFYGKFDWVRRDPWNEGEAPFVEIAPTHKSSWGLE
ncbi:MAG TPA: pyridoxamine 5'-phosphate oxidase family protein [Nitrososphaeraceae archaeon]|jgi:nitroimidazol reductase NimA-like FMN-containing flavoprotein (pyridoxamine 5'-phosphate oxidase superfamily)